MARRALTWAALLLVASWPGISEPAQAPPPPFPMPDSTPARPTAALDYSALARRIVSQLALQRGEKVLLVAWPGLFSELVAPLRYEVMRAGGVDMGCGPLLPLRPPPVSGRNAGAAARAVAASRDALRERLRDVDAAVMLPGATPEH